MQIRAQQIDLLEEQSNSRQDKPQRHQASPVRIQARKVRSAAMKSRALDWNPSRVSMGSPFWHRRIVLRRYYSELSSSRINKRVIPSEARILRPVRFAGARNLLFLPH